MFNLNGRVAIITGGSGGLGVVMAQGLAKAGADVVLVGRNQDKLNEAAKQVAEVAGQAALPVVCDVTNKQDVERMVAEVLAAYGRIDILINNAGINVRQPIAELDEETWNRIQKTNLTAPLFCSQAVFKPMKEQKYGRIIHISSMLGQVALPERGSYCSSKGGLIQLGKVMALEWAEHQITVNTLCPGPIATELNQVVINNPEANQLFIDNIALGRWGRPDELQGAVLYLAAEESSFMTGTTLVVDGGWTAR
jgi:NAD(P)-dependent dehydrogenase (short-subunit alcohol dehydrogenase family)